MKVQTVLYYWPQSQICMECKHGQFIHIDNSPSAYICMKGEINNDGIICHSFEEEEQND